MRVPALSNVVFGINLQDFVSLNPGCMLANNQAHVEQYRGGNEKVFGFFVGQVMKASQGKANPGQVNQLLKDKLKG